MVEVESKSETAVRLRMVLGRFGRNLRRTEAGAKLTSTETNVLGAVVGGGQVGLSQLAVAEGMNPTMLSRIVRHLEEYGLVVRRPDPDDGRVGLVEATKAGRRLDERIRTERTDALSIIVDQLGARERHALDDALPVLETIASELNARRQ